jgi:hypothetical protein
MAGLGTAGAFFFTQKNEGTAAHAAPASYQDSHASTIQTILNIAVTAEHLGVTFYALALRHADWLDLNNTARRDLKAALIEEAIHLKFLLSQGAHPLTTRFSFPHGDDTFRHFNWFISTQQLLETLFTAAYIAAIKEFAQLTRPDLAQVAAQIGTVEAEHRVMGRAIAGLTPANNHAFSPALLKRVADAPAVMKKLGFLGSNYSYDDYKSSFSMDSSDVSMRDMSGQDWS